MSTVSVAPRLDTPTLLGLLERMAVIRRFEERAAELYRDGEIPGFVHLSIGQEATAVGACWPLDDGDGIVSTHRGHGHCLAKGASPEGMMAELMGRATGTCGGLGGSMHIADTAKGVYGANGIVGAGLPIACGVASAFGILGRGDVVVAFFGDGAIAQGAFHEAVNLAAVWRLPVVFLCENNGYAEFSPFAAQHPVPVLERAAAYGIPAHHVDGNDIEAVALTMARLVGGLRDGSRPGPVLVEATTYRIHGHYEGDPQRYRAAGEVEEWKTARDPLAVAAARLTDRGVDPAEITTVLERAAARVEAAVTAARAAPAPEMATARRALAAPRLTVRETPIEMAGGDYRVMDAVSDALRLAMEDDPTVWVAGIDVAAGGNVFGLTRGLAERFPGRVRDTPISETAILGAGVGGAMAGTRPVVEIMYLDFIGVCLDQLLNQAAKLRFMTGGTLDIPLVVRTQFGAGRSSAAQHSQSLEALLAHIPGLSVVMPSNPADTYGLLRSAIEDPNPVIVIDHRLLYGFKGAKPPTGHRVPIGRGAIRRPGTDVTVVTWSRMVHHALAAAEQLAEAGISAEVVDMRSVAPLDVDLVAASVRRTGRLLVAHEAALTGGLGAEIAAQITDACWWDLDAPVRRLAPEPIPAPYSPHLEQEWLVDVQRIVAAVTDLARF
jgi:2-oxoisovalerate dehydrogenase E1 component